MPAMPMLWQVPIGDSLHAPRDGVGAQIVAANGRFRCKHVRRVAFRSLIECILTEG